MRAKLEILALVLGTIGLVGTIAVTAMPMWKVTAYIGSNIIVMETLWEGLWMVCIRQADINMQCKVYDYAAHPAGGHPGGPRAHVRLHHSRRPGRPGVRLRDEGHRLLPR